MTKPIYKSQNDLSANRLCKHFTVLVISIFLLSFPLLAQQANDSRWLYMGTDAEANRYYIQEKTEKTDSGYIQGWMKTIATDGISSKRMYQWDCNSTQMRMLSVAVYNPDNTLAYSDEKIRDWKLVVPDTVGDRMLDKLCKRKKDIYIAEITSTKANMRIYPGTKNKILKTASKGETFRVVSSLKDKSWYNVVNEATQEDYWIHHSTIKVYIKK